MATQLQFNEPGALAPPGIIGRAIRLALGGLCVYVVVAMLANAQAFFSGSAFDEPSAWVLILIALYVFPHVINIGFGKTWKTLPLRAGLVALGCGAGLLSHAVSDRVFGPPLGVFLTVWMLYTYAHLGISLLLATILATPGCEMRSISHLWGLVSGRKATAHYCPGMLTPIDRWEAKLGAHRQ